MATEIQLKHGVKNIAETQLKISLIYHHQCQNSLIQCIDENKMKKLAK